MLAPKAAENKGGRPRKPNDRPISAGLVECSDCGCVISDDGSGVHRPGCPRLPDPECNVVETSAKLAEVSATARETRKVAAIGTGYSGSTLDKVDDIRDVAEKGIVKRGKTTVPAPETVRETARAALDDVKQTGAAVESSHSLAIWQSGRSNAIYGRYAEDKGGIDRIEPISVAFHRKSPIPSGNQVCRSLSSTLTPLPTCCGPS